MFCWGNNRYDQLGLVGVEDEICPVPVENKYFENRLIKQISCGYQHTLFLLNDGTVLSCGCNQYAQLGYEGDRRRPEQIRSLETFFIEQVACGHSFSLALTDKKKVICWGSMNGQRDNELFFPKPT
jgi:E3 ubiquitin-protein ligase HERC4